MKGCGQKLLNGIEGVWSLVPAYSYLGLMQGEGARFYDLKTMNAEVSRCTQETL